MRTSTLARSIGLTLGLMLLVTRSVLAGSFPPAVDLSALDGIDGLTLRGGSSSGFAGVSVGDAGDLNGDGFSDIVIGAFLADGDTDASGEACVVFGPITGLPSSFELSTLDGTNGFVLDGEEGLDYAGEAVSGGGDVNGDGISDVVIGAPFAEGLIGGGGTGVAYVVFGSDQGFPPVLELDTLDGTNGFRIGGANSEHRTGASVDIVGDVNGDGVADILIGSPGAQVSGLSRAGRADVVFGSATGFAPWVLLDVINGTNGFTIEGTVANGQLGSGVSRAGDVNADGMANLIVGGRHSGAPGQALVVFGSTLGFPASMDRSDLDGSNGFVVDGVQGGDLLGDSVSDAGDVNGDGISDIVIGASGTNFNGLDSPGASHVIYGSDQSFAPTLAVSDLDGTNGFVLRGTNQFDELGYAVSSAGDLDLDGFSDVLVGTLGTNDVYVLYGGPSLASEAFVSSIDGTNGFVLNGAPSSTAGRSVADVGDMNGDGGRDFLIGAPLADQGDQEDAGEAYLIYGGAPCENGTTSLATGILTDSLYLQGSRGGVDRTVEVPSTDFLRVAMVETGAGGNGKFVLHANVGLPTPETRSTLPFDIGTTCFPFLLSEGADPLIIANNIGRTGRVGASRFRDIPWADPERASTEFLYSALPAGTVLTFQALIVDPSSRRSKSVSVTNAVILNVVP